MKIRAEALELALRTVLSCPCPVTAEQERHVYELLRAAGPGEVLDYIDILAVFDRQDTPFHRLGEFVTWTMPVGREPLVERHHVLRVNASTLHWRHAASTLSGAIDRVACLSSWLIAHMLLPVRLETDAEGEPQGVYEHQTGRIELRHLFVPPELGPAADGWWAVHFAAVLGPLDIDEHRLVVDLTEANDQLALHRRRVTAIDYRDFELQGDNAEFCRRRHAAYWGGEGV